MPEERVKKILSLLEKAYPDAALVLHYKNPLELLVATILAAQCTDERVNKVTETLFKKYTSARVYAGAEQGVFEQEIHSTGFYRNKTKNIIACAKGLVERFDGRYPIRWKTWRPYRGWVERRPACSWATPSGNRPWLWTPTSSAFFIAWN